MTKEDLQKFFKDKVVKGRYTLEFFVDETDLDWVERLVREFSPQGVFTWNGKGESGKRIHVKTLCEVTDKYFRAIAKIGFHYFLKQFQDEFTGNEPYFNDIKNFIQNGGEWEPFVTQMDRQIISEFDQDRRLVNYGHILTATHDNYGIFSKAQFFVGLDHVPRVWVIKLANKKSSVIFFEGKANLFLYHDLSLRGQYDGIMDEIGSYPLPTLVRLR